MSCLCLSLNKLYVMLCYVMFMIYVTPTASLIRKTEEGLKLTDNPKTYQKNKTFINLVIGQISELKMAISILYLLLIFFLFVFFVYFLCFNSTKCVLITS